MAPPKKFIDRIEKLICQKYDDDLSISQLAKMFSCSRTAIHNVLKRNGKKRRNRGAESDFTNFQDEFIMSNYEDCTNREMLSSEILEDKTIIELEKRGWYLVLTKSDDARSRANFESQIGKKLSIETKEKMRKAHLGMKQNPESIAKMRKAKLGKKITQEHKDKISRTRKEKIKNGEIEVPSGYGKSGIREDIGHFVRSRWEANYCRILKKFEIPYQYEPRRFIINKFNTTYRPDIYIPELNLYIEIKGHWYPGKKEIFEVFKEEHPEINIITIEKNDYKELKRKYSKIITNWEV